MEFVAHLIERFLAEFGHIFEPLWWQTHGVAILNVIMIDIVLAGDNAIIVGLAASRVAPETRGKVIFWGIMAAVALRIAFSAVTLQLLAIIGLTLAGGILLLWVVWKMFRQVTGGNHDPHDHELHFRPLAASAPEHQIGFRTAVLQIALADVSMSLDNVLAVAGVAKESWLVLVLGLSVSIVLMAAASHVIAQLLVRYPWISWIGLLLILYVAIDMIVRGINEVVVCLPVTGEQPCPQRHFGLWELLTSRL